MFSIACLFFVLSRADQLPFCSREIVDRAAADGFLNFVLVNCLDDSSGNNMAGSPVLGPADCLTQFMITKQSADTSGVVNGIPLSGACRDTYQDFISTIHGSPANVIADCVYDPTTESAVISYECGTLLGPLFTNFQTSNLISIMGSEGQCPESMIRARSDGVLGHIVASLDQPGTPERFESAEYGLCDMCYSWFLADFSFGMTLDPTEGTGYADLIENCSGDPRSEYCTQSITVANADEKFQICAGKSIFFVGPSCEPREIDIIKSLIPNPYLALTKCTIAPNTVAFCPTIPGYLEHIRATSDGNCLSCYSEYMDAVTALVVRTPAISSACGDIYSDACISQLSSALLAFSVCAGFRMEEQSTAEL
jgi:hypothetical protein